MQTVLLVEDDSIGEALVEMLQMFGYKVVWAQTLDQGFESFEECKHDDVVLVIVDFHVPGGDTLSLQDKIAQTYKGLMIAASDNTEARRLQMSHGCTHETRTKLEIQPLVMELLGLSFAKAA